MADGAAASLTVAAPAKLNLFLHVTGRRPDGYHLLESLMVLIDLADTLRLSCRDDGRLVRTHSIDGVPLELDLAYRAAHLLQQHTKTRLGVSIALEKRIPLGAGLGGGSSDAASVLLGLNRLWALDLSREELMRLGLELGADVPFFIFGSNAHVSGIGEILEPMTVPRMDVLLAIPAVNVPTKAIFAAPGLKRDTPPSKCAAFAAGYGSNDLQPVARASHPAIAAAAAYLEGLPAALPRGWPDSGVRMSGSGSTVFRVIARDASAVAVAEVGAFPDSRRDSPGSRPSDPMRRGQGSQAPSAGVPASAFRVIEARVLSAHPLREFVAK